MTWQTAIMVVLAWLLAGITGTVTFGFMRHCSSAKVPADGITSMILAAVFFAVTMWLVMLGAMLWMET